MSDTKATYTAGPWRQGPAEIPGGDLTVFGAEGDLIVAATYIQGGPNIQVSAANARLIAAAPEMHAALIRLVNYSDSCEYGSSADEPCAGDPPSDDICPFHEGLAALARAEGRQP